MTATLQLGYPSTYYRDTLQTKVDPQEYFKFTKTYDYRLIFRSNRGAVIEGRSCKRIVPYYNENYWLRLPYMYYFFRKSGNASDHLAVTRIAGSWTPIKSPDDPMIILPLPNFYSSKPCYYPHRVYNRQTSERYLIDPRAKEYPSFDDVVHSHLLALWNSGGNDDASRMYSSNKAYAQLRKIYNSTPSMQRDRHFTGLHAALKAWENTPKTQLVKLNWKPIKGISSIWKEGEFLRRSRSA